MKQLIALAFILVSSVPAALAMPSDTGYHCVSATGRYDITLRSNRYINDLSLVSAKINGVEIKSATLGPAFDGDFSLSFQINLPTKAGSIRVLSVETNVSHKGILKSKYMDSMPGEFNVERSEAITCTADGEDA